jgi:serine/threonine-protein kinase RsbW
MPKISITNKIENLEKVANFIEQFCTENNLNDNISFDLHLVEDELTTNIINYAFDDNLEHTIDISIKLESGDVKMQIFDDGKEFNILEAKEANVDLPLEERQIGGLGIFLVKQKMDLINYERKENKNILTLIKRTERQEK